MDTETLVSGVIAVVAVAIVIAIVVARDRKRTAAVTQVAQQLGFTFEDRKPSDTGQFADLRTVLFRRGSGRSFRNIMTGSSDDMRISLFDYSFAEGAAGSSTSLQQTVAAYSKTGLTLPEFELAPFDIAQKIDSALGNKGLRFDSHPEFSKRYQLQAADEAATRALFTPALLSYLEGLDSPKKWRLEGMGETVTVYRLRKRVNPADLRNFLDETKAIADSFFALADAEKPVP